MLRVKKVLQKISIKTFLKQVKDIHYPEIITKIDYYTINQG